MSRLFSCMLCFCFFRAEAQEFVLYSSRWMDLNNKSTSRTASVIYVDSSRITIEQGESRLYLDILGKSREENRFRFSVMDFNDATNTAFFSPEAMTFDYYAGAFRLRYFLDSIQRAGGFEAEPDDVSGEIAGDSLETDSVAVEEDNRIYTSSETAPEFPGGAEAMKIWLAANVKYPAAAKRDKIIGQVEISAVVERNGSLSDITIKRDIGGGCGAEAVRAVKAMPAWVPGQIQGEDKRVRTSIKVFFPPG